MVFSSQILGATPEALARFAPAAVMASALVLTGCGQKGPLFIATPPTLPAPVATAPAPATVPAAPAALPASAASVPR